MKKDIKSIERILPADNQGEREIIVVETTDNIRYIFDNHFDTEYVRFSHRYYPNREPNSQYQSGNHRLPEVVENEVEKRAGKVKMMDGMIKEAHQNREAVARFNGHKSNQSA